MTDTTVLISEGRNDDGHEFIVRIADENVSALTVQIALTNLFGVRLGDMPRIEVEQVY